MTKEETRKRLEEVADKFAESDETLTYEEGVGTANGFIVGAEWMFKEAGGDMVLREMRKMIVRQVTEWMKWNIQPKYIYIEDDGIWIDNAQLLHDFEADMNKLWEGEGCSE